MSKLIVITRSNLDMHQFCNVHNVSENDVVICKSLKDLEGVTTKDYVVLPPGPRNFHWTIRPYLILNGFKNKTKYYNRRLNRF